MAAVFLLPVPMVLAMDTGVTGAGTTDAELVGADRPLDEATPAELRAILDDLTLRHEALVADNASLQEVVDGLAAERDELARSLSHLDELYDPLEADRQLLFELRKGLPETRPEAESQLERMRSLALSADPSRLGQLVDRVDEAAPAFLEWRFTEFASDMEATQAYVDSGAGAFDTSMSEFRNEVLMSVANRLDGLLTVIDRLR
jgi:ABC-type transporter Mla subunit MlaD